MVKQLGVALAAAVAVSGLCGAASAKNTVSGRDKMFVKMASQGNLAEVMTSQLALRKTQNKDVQMVAHRLIKDHGQAESDLKTTLSSRYAVPSQTDPMHMAMYRKLSRLSGAAFDKAYMSGQVKDHDKTVTLFKSELSAGRDSEARNYAQKYLPGIQDHTIMIHNVAANLGADPSLHHNVKAKKANDAST